MRIFSTSIAKLVQTSTLLPETLKASIVAHDTLHAQIFEAFGASAIYCITPQGTRLQFIGVHQEQTASARKIVEGMGDNGTITLMTACGVETARADEVLEVAEKRNYTLCGGTVFDKVGNCIASGLRIVEEGRGCVVYYQPEHSTCESSSNLSALRQIAVAEAAMLGAVRGVKKIQLGSVDITWPLRAKPSTRSCSQIWSDRHPIACSPLPIATG